MNDASQLCWWIAAMLVLGDRASLSADRVRLRSGKVVEGMFIGGDSKTVRVLLDNGQVSEVRLEDDRGGRVLGAETGAAPAAAAAAAARQAAAAAPKPRRARAQAGDRAGRHAAERPADGGDRRGRLAGRPDVQGRSSTIR